MLDFFLKGGLMMWPILLCSIFGLAIIVERFYYLQRIRPPKISLLGRVKGLLKEEKPLEALRLCENLNNPIAHILAVGIQIRKRSLEDKERCFKLAGSKLLRAMEKNLRGLAVIANIATLLGLLGTVTGMIQVFMKIESVGGQADVSVLAGGIWEALITTAAGLFVAIPASFFYYYFEGRVDELSSRIKETAEELLEL